MLKIPGSCCSAGIPPRLAWSQVLQGWHGRTVQHEARGGGHPCTCTVVRLERLGAHTAAETCFMYTVSFV